MNPTDAEHFEATMRAIWDGHGPDCADALAYARVDTTEIGPADNGMDEPAFLFRFPDGSHAIISRSGVMLTKDRT